MDLSLEDTITQVVALPERLQRTYYLINLKLYGEPGFSDLTPAELAANMGGDTELVGWALIVLKEAGLVWVEDTEVNGFPYHFIHTTAHDKGWVQNGKVIGPH